MLEVFRISDAGFNQCGQQYQNSTSALKTNLDDRDELSNEQKKNLFGQHKAGSTPGSPKKAHILDHNKRLEERQKVRAGKIPPVVRFIMMYIQEICSKNPHPQTA